MNHDAIAEGVVATAAMMKELDDGEPSLLSSNSSVWKYTVIDSTDFKNALEAIQSHKQEAEAAAEASKSAARLSITPEEARRRGFQNVLAISFTGAELVEQLVAVTPKKISRAEAVAAGQSLLDNGVIECVDTLRRRETISLGSASAAQGHTRFNESFTYTPVLLHELSDKLIRNLLGLLRSNNSGGVGAGAKSSISVGDPSIGGGSDPITFKEADAQECWTRLACGVVPTRQDASEICQEMVNKGFIEPTAGNSVFAKTLRWGESRGPTYAVRGEQHLYWGPLLCPGWKVQWFLCKSASDKKLYCFRSPKQARPRAFIDLSEAYFSSLGGLDFVIETPTKVWKLQALSQEALERWRRVVEQSSAYIYATNKAIDILTNSVAKSAEKATKRFLAANGALVSADLRRRRPAPSDFPVIAPFASIDYSGAEKTLAERDLPCVLQTTAWDHVTALTLAGRRLWTGTMKGSVYATALSYPRKVVASSERLSCLGNKRNASTRGPHKDRVVAFAATTKMVWSGDAAGSIAVWSASDCSLVGAFDYRPGRPIVAAADHIRELVYLSGVRPGTVEVVQAAGTPDRMAARLVVTLPECTGDVLKIRVSSDCRTWWAAGPQQDRAIYEVDAEKQAVVRRMRVPDGLSPAVSFMPSESTTPRGLWTSHAGGELCFWDVEGGRIYARRSGCKGHGWAAENLWVKRGRAVTLGKDGDIVEWDANGVSIQRGIVPVGKIHTDRGCIQTLGCDPNASYIAVTNEVNEIIVYDSLNRF